MDLKTRQRRKKVLEQAKGYYSAKSRLFRIATEAVDKALQYAYRDRKVKKREFRSLWIIRINAAVRAAGLTYSQFIAGVKRQRLLSTGKHWLIWLTMIQRHSANSQSQLRKSLPHKRGGSSPNA